MKNKFEKPLVAAGTMLYPLYTLPWIIKYMLKNNNLGYILFSFMMAYFAYIMIPYENYDMVRHYEAFNRVSTMSFSTVFENETMITKYPLHIYMWFINQIGLTKEFVPFSLIFIHYMLFFLTLRKIFFYKNINKELRFWIIFLGVFLIVNEIRFIDTASGMRNGLAFSIFIYASIEYFLNNKKIKFFILSIIAVMAHASVILPIFLLIFSNFFQLIKIGKMLLSMSLLLLISGMSGEIFYSIVHMLEPFLRSHNLYISYYLDQNGEWGGGYYQIHSDFKTLVFEKILKPLPFYLSGVYLIFIKIRNQKIQSYLYYLYISITLVSVSRTFLDRYSYFFVLFFIFIFILEIKAKNISKYTKFFITVFISSLLAMNITFSLAHRGVIFAWSRALYTPVPIMMMHDVKPKDYIHRKSL